MFFLICRQSQTGYFYCKGGRTILLLDMIVKATDGIIIYNLIPNNLLHSVYIEECYYYPEKYLSALKNVE